MERASPFPADPALGRAARGIGWLGGSQLLSQSFHLAIRLVLARLLTPADFGIVAAAAVVTAALSAVLDLGMGTALIQRSEIDESHRSSAFWITLALAVLTAVLVSVAAPLGGVFYRDESVVAVLRWLSLGLVLGAPEALLVALRSREFDFRTIGLQRVIATLMAGLAALVAAFKGLGVWSLVAYTLLRQLFSLVLLVLGSSWRPRLRFCRRAARELWAFGGPLIISRVLNLLNRSADNLLIGRFLGTYSLGLYALSYQGVLLPLQYLARPVGAVSLPLLSSLEHEPSRQARAFVQGTESITIVTWAVALLVSTSAPTVLPLLLGSQWSPAIAVLQILSFVAGIQATLTLVSPALLARGRTATVARFTALSLGANLVAFAIGLRWGLVGVAVAYLTATVITAVPQLVYVLKLLEAPAQSLLRLARGIAAGTAAFASVVWLAALVTNLRENVWIGAATLVLGIAAYAVLIAFLLPVGWGALVGALRALLRSRVAGAR